MQTSAEIVELAKLLGPFPGVEARPGRDADHSPHPVQRSRTSRSYIFSLSLLHGGSGTALIYLLQHGQSRTFS
jgi:hypothetical protein